MKINCILFLLSSIFCVTAIGQKNWRSNLQQRKQIHNPVIDTLSAFRTAQLASSRSNMDEQWNKLASGVIPEGEEVNSIKIIDENIVWMISSNYLYAPPIDSPPSILRSIDGGVSWEQFQIPDTEGFYGIDIAPIDAMTAYVVLWGADFFNDLSQDAIYKTTDGGMTWNKVESYSSSPIYIHFFNENEGWVFGADISSGDFGLIIMSSTSDGGQTWEHAGGDDWLIPEGREFPVQDDTKFVGTFFYSPSGNYAVNGSTIIIGGTNYWISYDKGYNWQSIESPLFTNHGQLTGIVALKDSLTFLLASNSDEEFFFAPTIAYATTDGGTTWIESNPIVNPSSAAYLPGTEHDFIITGQTLGVNPSFGITGTARTSDLATWDVVTEEGLLSTDFIGENKGIGAYANYAGDREASNIYSWGAPVTLDYDALVTRNNDYPLKIVTLNHLAQEIIFEYTLENTGLNALTDTEFKMDIFRNGELVASDSDIFTVDVANSQVSFLSYLPTEVGLYEFIITANQAGFDTSFFQDSRLLEVSETTLAKDDNNWEFFFVISPDNLGYFGSEFNLLKDDKLESFSIVLFEAESDSTSLFNFQILPILENNRVGEPVYKLENIAAIDIFNDDSFMNIELPETVNLTAGRYIFAVGQDVPQDNIAFGFDDRADFGSWLLSISEFLPWDNLADGSFPTLMLRPHFEAPMSNNSQECLVTQPEIISLDYSHVWLSWNEETNFEAYTVIRREVGAIEWDTIQDWQSAGIIVSRLKPCTEYEYQVSAICGEAEGAFSASQIFKTEGCEDPYCSAYGSATNNWIETARFGDQFLMSGEDFGYNNFTHLPFDTLNSRELEIELTPGSRAGNENARVFWSVWIDFNQDNQFDNVEERVLSVQGDGQTSIINTIIIPEDALPGATRARVAMDIDEAKDVCAVSGLREVEDYTLTIGQLTTTPIRKVRQLPLFTVVTTPNPFKENLFIQLKTESREPAIVQLLDRTGQLIRQFALSNNNQIMHDLSDLPTGLYLLKVFQEGTFVTKKVIKQ